jgi:hypothetical protein
MTFSEALEKTKAGERVWRTGWPIYWKKILAQSNTKGDTGPWVPSQADMLANDWEVVTDDGS